MSIYKELVDVIKEFGVVHAPRGQEFTLASGATSKFYVDFSRVMMVPMGVIAVTQALMHHIDRTYDIIGGPSSGADPIIGALLTRTKFEVRGFTIRKEPKGRGPGAGDMFEGYIKPGLRAVVIEDVTTSGGSVMKAIKEVEKQGASVVRVISLLDRQAGADKLLKDYHFSSLVRLDDLGLK